MSTVDASKVRKYSDVISISPIISISLLNQRVTGADPGFRRGGGGFVHSEGGVLYRNFRSGSKLLQGPGQINKQKKIADSRGGGGGGSDHPKKNLYPRLGYEMFQRVARFY